MVPRFVGRNFTRFLISFWSPRYEGLDLGIPVEIGGIDIVEVIRWSVYPIQC